MTGPGLFIPHTGTHSQSWRASDQRRQGFLDSPAVNYVGRLPGSIDTHALADHNGRLWVTRPTQFLHMGWKVRTVVPTSRALSIRGVLLTYSVESWNAGMEVGIDGDVCMYLPAIHCLHEQ